MLTRTRSCDLQRSPLTVTLSYTSLVRSATTLVTTGMLGARKPRAILRRLRNEDLQSTSTRYMLASGRYTTNESSSLIGRMIALISVMMDEIPA